jgi:hypothetical protein
MAVVRVLRLSAPADGCACGPGFMHVFRRSEFALAIPLAVASAIGASGVPAVPASAASPVVVSRIFPVQADPRQALVSVEVAPETVTVGDRFSVRVRVRAPKVAAIRFPEVPALSGPVEPVDPRTTSDGAPGELLDRTATYTFVAWDVGTHPVPFDSLVVTVAGRDRAYSLGTPTIRVRSLLPADSAAQVPRDARAPLALPGREWQYAILALIAAVLAMLWLRHRRIRRELGPTRAPPEAWAEARAAFEALDALGLAESGEPGRHVIAHVDVLRRYLERRFPAVPAGLDAPLAVAKLTAADFPVPVPRVASLLERDAEVRFARATVDRSEAVALGQEAREITTQVQVAYEARLRALERPARPRRR